MRAENLRLTRRSNMWRHYSKSLEVRYVEMSDRDNTRQEFGVVTDSTDLRVIV